MTAQTFIQYGFELIVLLIVGYVLYKIQMKKPDLVSYLTNTSIFPMPGPPAQTLGTHAIIIQNNGRGTAEDIEVCHDQLPYINVFPDIQYQIEDTPQGGKILKFNSLLKKQRIIISYLYMYSQNPTVFLPKYVKSKEMNARIIQTFHSPIYSKKLQYVAGGLMLMGCVFFMNLLVELVKFIIRSV